MNNGSLVRISSTLDSGALREESAEGRYKRPPMVGEPFVLVAPPTGTIRNYRLVMTSLVTEIRDVSGGTTTFVTESGSVYVLGPIGGRQS